MNKALRVELQCEKISALKFFGVFDDSEEEIPYAEEEEEIIYKKTAVADRIHFVGIDPFFSIVRAVGLRRGRFIFRLSK